MALRPEVVLRQIPAHLLDGYHAGHYRLAGSIIQQVADGRIVGHLQPTSALLDLAGAAANPVGAAAKVVTGVVSIVQNEQIKAGIALVQQLQWANLALTGAGMGISIAGTALLMRQVDRLSQRVDGLHEQLASVAGGVRQLQAEPLRRDLARMDTLARQVDEAWLPGARDDDWLAIARDAHFLADQFRARAQDMAELPVAEGLESVTDAYALASNLRVTARLAAGQDAMARAAADERADVIFALGEAVRLSGRLARLPDEDVGAAQPASHSWLTAVRSRQTAAIATAERARERVLQAASCLETLAELDRQGIAGREWLLAARQEQEAPVLFLASDAAV